MYVYDLCRRQVCLTVYRLQPYLIKGHPSLTLATTTMFLQCPPIFASQMLETNLPPPDLRSMDHFLAPSTPEALAHNHLTYVTHDMTLHLSLRFCLMAERTSSPGTQSIRPWTKLFSPGVPLIRPLTVISAAQISFCCPDPEVNSRAFCELFFWLDSGS